MPPSPQSFRKLTPNQLPHPTFPPQSQSLPTTLPIYMESPSIVTTRQQFQPQVDRVYQFTNPVTNPNLYQPNTPHYSSNTQQTTFHHLCNTVPPSPTPSITTHHFPPNTATLKMALHHSFHYSNTLAIVVPLVTTQITIPSQTQVDHCFSTYQ
jgi:hypothetical protein